MDKWDRRFLNIAREVSLWSKDPSTQVGAVIVSPNRDIVATGYNGFAKGVDDCHEHLNDREIKSLKVVHAETNAIVRSKRDLTGYTLYTYPIQSCPHCAATIIQTGISRVVSLDTPHERLTPLFPISNDMFKQAGIDVVVYEQKEYNEGDGNDNCN